MDLKIIGGIVTIDDWMYYTLSKYKWRVGNRGYCICYHNRKLLYMHRVILGIENPKILCDHINRNRLDNRITNLRIVTYKENSRNRTNTSSKSKYKGVTYQYPGKYNYIKAKIRVDNKLIHLGTFKTEIEAAKAYNEAAIKYFGEYACLNEL